MARGFFRGHRSSIARKEKEDDEYEYEDDVGKKDVDGTSSTQSSQESASDTTDKEPPSPRTIADQLKQQHGVTSKETIRHVPAVKTLPVLSMMPTKKATSTHCDNLTDDHQKLLANPSEPSSPRRNRHCRKVKPTVLTRNPDLMDMKPLWANSSKEAARQKDNRREVQRQYLRWQQYYSCQRYQQQFQQERQLKQQRQQRQQQHAKSHDVVEEEQPNVLQVTPLPCPTTTWRAPSETMTNNREEMEAKQESTQVYATADGTATPSAIMETESGDSTNKVENVRMALSMVQKFYKKNGSRHASLFRHSSTTFINMERTIEEEQYTDSSSPVSSSCTSSSSDNSSSSSSSSSSDDEECIDDIGSVPSSIFAIIKIQVEPSPDQRHKDPANRSVLVDAPRGDYRVHDRVEQQDIHRSMPAVGRAPSKISLAREEGRIGATRQKKRLTLAEF
jgi:hypothetical protein